MGGACFLLQYDRRLVMPWLVDNAIMCGLLFLIVVGGAMCCVILTASQLKDDLTTLTYGFLILVPGSCVVGNVMLSEPKRPHFSNQRNTYLLWVNL
jgi:hypothetical protein